VIEASSLDSHEHLARPQRRCFLDLNLNDLRTAGTEGASYSPMSNRAHFDNDIIQPI
jgi:hypothetical protein